MVKISPLKLNHVNNIWIKWLNDKIVTRYSIQNKKRHTLRSQILFIKDKLNNKTCKLFKISYNSKFVGIIELKNIDKKNKCTELSYMIGERDLWGFGIATKSINLILKYAKHKLNINKVLSGIMSPNIASKKVLVKNKFKKYGEIKKFYNLKNKYVSKVLFIRYLI